MAVRLQAFALAPYGLLSLVFPLNRTPVYLHSGVPGLGCWVYLMNKPRRRPRILNQQKRGSPNVASRLGLLLLVLVFLGIEWLFTVVGLASVLIYGYFADFKDGDYVGLLFMAVLVVPLVLMVMVGFMFPLRCGDCKTRSIRMFPLWFGVYCRCFKCGTSEWDDSD